MKVSPSVLAAPLTRLAETVRAFDPEVIHFVHMDIMDGHFVPALTFGEAVTEAISGDTDIPLDVHLMVSQPHKEVPKYFKFRPHNITFHYEATSFPVRLAQSIREQGIKAGIALNPSTPVEVLRDIWHFFDLVLLMTVEPGYYGQSFLPNSFDRLRRFAVLREECKAANGHDVILEVDGGVSDQNITDLSKAGVDVVVAGSYLFKAASVNEAARKLL